MKQPEKNKCRSLFFIGIYLKSILGVYFSSDYSCFTKTGLRPFFLSTVTGKIDTLSIRPYKI